MSGFLQKIAHNNRVSLGPKDIRTLAELISSEKRVVESTQRIAADRTKASLALKEWGVAEGSDLGDVLSKMAQLFDCVSAAEGAYAQHNANFRLFYKGIRTKEEHLAALKRSQTALASKIETQERKVSKMKEENKDLPNAKEKLQEMKQEMVGLENTVINEETRLGDFKRTTTREAMSLKLGALLELAEKTVIICEIGKLIVDEIPTERTEAGMQRSPYRGFDRTETSLNEAIRCLGEVVFNPTPFASQPAGGARDDSGEELRPAHIGGDQYGSLNSANAYPAHSYSSQQEAASASATYGSPYGEYRGNEQDFPSPTQYSLNNNSSYTSPQLPQHEAYAGESSLHPGMLPSIRTTSPLPGVDHLSSPSSPGPPPIPGGGLPQSHLLSRMSGYEDEASNRSSLAYMGVEDEPAPVDDYEQRQADEDAEQRRREDEYAREEDEQRRREGEYAMSDDRRRTLPAVPVPAQLAYHEHEYQPDQRGSVASIPPMSFPGEGRDDSTIQRVPSPPEDDHSESVVAAPSSPAPLFTPVRPSNLRGESALGSKHGDIYVPGANTGGGTAAAANGGAGPFQGAGTSGYNARTGGGGDASSIGSGSGGGKANAGAFRRFQAPPRTQFSLPPPQQGDSRYPTPGQTSQAATIRDQYYATSPGEQQQQQGGGEGPRFDVSPLQVQKRQERQAVRAGTMPLPGSPGPPSIQIAPDYHPDSASNVSTSTYGGPPPPQYDIASPTEYTAPASPSGGSGSGHGFGAGAFVTRLD